MSGQLHHGRRHEVRYRRGRLHRLRILRKCLPGQRAEPQVNNNKNGKNRLLAVFFYLKIATQSMKS